MSLKEIRKHKIFGIAIFDLSISFVAIIIIFLIAWKSYYHYLDWWKFLIAALIVTLPISIFAHVLFGVNTQLNYSLGLSDKPEE